MFNWFSNLFSRSDSSPKRFDKWGSASHGFNAGRDKMAGFFQQRKPRLALWQLRELYRANRIIRRIINTMPNEMIKKTWVLQHSKPEIFEQEIKRLGIYRAFCTAEKRARQFGAGYILFKFNDKLPLEEPANLRRTTKIESIAVLDKNYMIPEITFPFQEVTHYRLWGVKGNQGLVHSSRVLFFDGEETDETTKLENQGTGESIIDQIVEELRDLSIAHGSAARIIIDFVQAIYRIKHLKALLKANKEEEIIEEFGKRNYLRSIANAVLLDADGEDFEKQTTSIAGLDQILEKLMNWFAAVVGMPKTLLFGTSPTGGLQSGDGQSEKRDWYDQVLQEMESKWRFLAEKFLNIIAQIYQLEDPILIFQDLWQQQLNDKQNAKLKQAAVDEKYIKLNVISRQEVRRERFPDSGFSYETMIDGDLPEPEKMEKTQSDDDLQI
jgi:phage-related protein (TIGR01555 family)